MAAPASFTSTQARIQEYCEWVTGNIKNNMPTRFADQNNRIRDYMKKMEEYWATTGRVLQGGPDVVRNPEGEWVEDDAWHPTGVDDIRNLGVWLRQPGYKANFDQGERNAQYLTILDNAQKMDPYSEDTDAQYYVAKQLINRNEWFNRSIVCITAGAVTVVAGIFTTEVVLLAGVVSAVFGAVMAVANFITYYGVEFDLDYHNAMKSAIDARGTDLAQAPAPAPNPAQLFNEGSNAGKLEVARDVLQSLRTVDRAYVVNARDLDRKIKADRAREFIFKNPNYKGKNDRYLAVSDNLPETEQVFKERLEPYLSKITNQSIRWLLERVRQDARYDILVGLLHKEKDGKRAGLIDQVNKGNTGVFFSPPEGARAVWIQGS